MNDAQIAALESAHARLNDLVSNDKTYPISVDDNGIPRLMLRPEDAKQLKDAADEIEFALYSQKDDRESELDVDHAFI
jgi:hypothetical protein